MIAYLNGQVRAKVSPRSIIIVTNGVGYLVQVSQELYLSLHIDSNVELYCMTVVREDSHTIFGFLTLWERNFFEVVLGVRMIGPSLAMQIASSFTVKDLIEVIESKSTRSLTALPGVGVKSAARILVELDSKIVAIKSMLGYEGTIIMPNKTPTGTTILEVEDALTKLGFDAREIRSALAAIETPASVEDGIRRALAELTQ